jgi:hypothetical protein
MRSRTLLLALALILVVPSAWPHAQRLRAGYQATFIAPPTGTIGSALAVDPSDPDGALCAIGGMFGTDQSVYHVDLTDPLSPVFTLIANGALDVSQYDGVNPNFIDGDDVLDSLFGSVGGLTLLPGGELIIVDNNERAFASPHPIPGDTVYIAEDLNGDSDFLDVVSGAPEVRVLVDPLPDVPAGSGFGGFSGAQTEVGPDGAVYVITADGGDAGEVIRIVDPTGSPSASIFFGGLDYGAGLTWDGADLLITELDDTFGFARLWRLSDGDSSGAIESGEETLVSSALPGAFDITRVGTGALVLSTFGEMYGLGAATGALEPQMLPGLGLFLGDVVSDGSAGAYAPHAGPGAQRIYTAGNDFAGTSRLIVFEPASVDTLTLQEAFYELVNLSPPDASLSWGWALAVSPVTPEIVYATLGSAFNTDHDVWSVDITDPTYPIHRLLSAGAADTGSDDQLDSLFGTVGGLAALPTGELVIVDNNAPLSGVGGDTVYLATDLNGDGDFLDVVASAEEVQALVATIPGAPAGSGFGGFSGTQAEVGPDGAVYVITADGGNGGEVLRFADPTGTASAEVYWEDASDGVDYGSGLAWVGGSLFTGDVDDSYGFARLRRHADGNADGDALDGVETQGVSGALAGVYDLAAGPQATLWRTQFGSLDELEPTDGSSVRTLALPTGFNHFGDLVFTSTAGPHFVPANANTDALVTQTTDFMGTTFLHLITTNPTVPAELAVFEVD